MSRIEIHTPGRSVTVDHDGQLADAEKTARRLWTLAGKAPADRPRVEAAAGFQAERAEAPAYRPDLDATLRSAE